MIKPRRPPRCLKCWGSHLTLGCTSPPTYGRNRNPAVPAPRFIPAPQHACDDRTKFSNYPGPSRLHEGMDAQAMIAWRKQRTREDAK